VLAAALGRRTWVSVIVQKDHVLFTVLVSMRQRSISGEASRHEQQKTDRIPGSSLDSSQVHERVA